MPVSGDAARICRQRSMEWTCHGGAEVEDWLRVMTSSIAVISQPGFPMSPSWWDSSAIRSIRLTRAGRKSAVAQVCAFRDYGDGPPDHHRNDQAGTRFSLPVSGNSWESRPRGGMLGRWRGGSGVATASTPPRFTTSRRTAAAMPPAEAGRSRSRSSAASPDPGWSRRCRRRWRARRPPASDAGCAGQACRRPVRGSR